MFAPVVARACEADLQVRGYLSMCWGDPWEGNVPIAYVVSVATKLFGLGCIELSLGDTIGVATPGRVVALIDALSPQGFRSNASPDRASPIPWPSFSAASPRSMPRSEVSSAVRTRKAQPRHRRPLWQLDGLGIHSGVL
jgi:hydroxymethylglutaryl-CoA lyase